MNNRILHCRLSGTLIRMVCGVVLAAVFMTVPVFADDSGFTVDLNPVDLIVDLSAEADALRRELLEQPHTETEATVPENEAVAEFEETANTITTTAMKTAATITETAVEGSIDIVQSVLGTSPLVNETVRVACSIPKAVIQTGYSMVIGTCNAALQSKGTVSGPVRVYTSMGDSVEAGLGLPQFNSYHKFVVANTNIRGSSPDLVGRALGAKVYQYHVPGARTSELRYLLDDHYVGDWITDGQLYDLSDGELDREVLNGWRGSYQNAVRQSDVVTLDIGFNDYWLPLYAAVYDVADEGHLPWDHMTAWERIEAMSPLGALADTVLSVGRAFLFHPLRAPFYALKFTDAFVKFNLDYPINMIAIADSIYELNPDATLLIVVGYNPMEDWDLVPAWDDNLVGDLFSILLLRHELARLYVALTYPGKVALVDARGIEIISDETTLFVFERMSTDDSGFNPHPTALGCQQLASQILFAMGKTSPYAVRETV